MGQIRKKIFLVLFVCCISLLASSMILFAMPSRYVNADEKIFSMVKGASCCLYDQGGIRFVVKMDRATANELKAEESTKSLHFIIGSRQNFDAVISANDEYINLVNGSTKYAHLVDIEKGKIYEEDGYFYANGCIWGLLENHRTLEWCAIAFISDGSGNVEYANFENNDINTSTRSFSFVLKKALLDENETRFDKIVETYSWIGTEDYKIEITTLDEYNDLLAKKQSFPDKYNSLIYNISATQTYTVNTITKEKNGNIQNSSFSNEAVIGDTVTISPEINDDYELQSIKVVNSNNEDVDINNGNTFIMPADTVEVEIVVNSKFILVSGDSKQNVNYYSNTGSGGSLQDITGPRVSIIDDEIKGKVLEFDAAATNVTFPVITVKTKKDLSRVYAISYDIKLISVSDNTEWAFVPNLAGSDQDRGDGYALSQTSIGKNLTIADGWQNVKLTGLNKALSSIVYNEATGEYTLEFKYINRFVSASGSARVFKFALCNLVYYAEDDNVIWDGATSELSKAVRNDTTNIQSVTMVDDVTRGKVLQVVSPAGKYPYLKITTKADLSAVTSISYHIKLVTNTGYTEGLSLLPAIPGGNSDRTDNYTSSTHLIGEQLNSTSGWVKVTLTGLNGTSTRKGETNYITYDEATGLYTIHLVWINRYDGSNNSIVGTVLLDDFMIEILF